MGYLEEQRDVVLDAMQHSGDLIARTGEPWGTTMWARTVGDAGTLRDLMREPVIELARKLSGGLVVRLALVESHEVATGTTRWGVLVELHPPDRG